MSDWHALEREPAYSTRRAGAQEGGDCNGVARVPSRSTRSASSDLRPVRRPMFWLVMFRHRDGDPAETAAVRRFIKFALRRGELESEEIRVLDCPEDFAPILAAVRSATPNEHRGAAPEEQGNSRLPAVEEQPENNADEQQRNSSEVNRA